MEKFFTKTILLTVVLSLAAAAVAGQDPVKKTEIVQNADGTYTVIEYPVGGRH